MSEFTVGSLFSGIGGLDLACEMAGFKTVWQVEKNDFCRQVLHKHWPDAAQHSDIFDCHHLPYVDLLTAGFPCQPFSIAGSRKGKDDERYLIPEMFRIIRELQPRAILFENVRGFTNIDDGHVFRDFLRAVADCGYDAEWACLRASDFGAPHQRERIFIVAYRQRHGYQGAGTVPYASVYAKRHHSAPEQGRQSVANAFVAGGQYVADPAIKRISTGEHSRRSKKTQSGINHIIETLGNPKRTGRKEPNTTTVSDYPGYAPRRPAARRSRRLSEPGMGRAAHGLAGGLDFPGFPAGQGTYQHPWEPPRTVEAKAPHHKERVQALGNAVVPAQAYPLAQAIHDWLVSHAV